jgi:hypothetical protein
MQPTPSATRLLYEISGARCFKTWIDRKWCSVRYDQKLIHM